MYLNIRELLTISCSEGQSELREMLADIVAENRKLKLDEAQHLEALMKGVQDAISQLQVETKRRKDIVQHRSEAVHELTSGDAPGPKVPWEDMQELSNNISSLADEVRLSASDQALLNSLRFDYMAQRQATVEPAHEQTFGWVLDPSSPVKFDDWLRVQNGIFWVNGKAGSGKSTLMKFLLDHIKTAESLRSWAGSKRLVTASFFFWNAGSSIQKSQEGLFRSLLYEILNQCPELIRTICSSKAKTFRPFVREHEPWTRQELWHAIAQLKVQYGARVRFCFFIDGLDEYDGEPNHIVSVLETLRVWPDVKLCVSSRPYNEFRDAFGRPSDPQLALEDLTRDDIRLYIQDTLEENLRFKALKARDDRTQDLVQDIVDRAQGVFLWVILVVRSLLKGLRNADRVSDLQKRLRDFPETLEKFFSHMIASIEPVYREQTAQAFKYALEAIEPLSLMTYSFLDEENLDNAVTAPLEPLTNQEVLSRQDDMRRRLNGRCKGLLEVVSRSRGKSNIYVEQYRAPRVVFLHRTVRDFLDTKDMQNMLIEHLEPSLEPKSRICKALLAQLKTINYSALEDQDWLPRGILRELIDYAREIEHETHVSQCSLIDEVGRCVSKHAGIFGCREGRVGFLEFIVVRGLYLYIAETLKTTTSLTQLDKSNILGALLECKGMRLLQFVATWPGAEMVDILLQHGAQPNEKYKHSTVWGNFLRSILEIGCLSYGDDGVLKMIESLLSHGADLQQQIVTGPRTETTETSERGVHSQKHQKAPSDIVKSAHQILLDELGEEKTSEMVEKARKDQTVLPQTVLPQTVLPSRSRWWSGRSLRACMKALKK